MIDAEYVEEIAVEVDALLRERETIDDRIRGWLDEAWAAGISHAELMREIDRQHAAVREAAPKPGQTTLAL